MNVTLRELISTSFAGGMRGGHTLKAVIPGGSSVPVLLPDQIDIPASFDGVAKAGSLLGSAGIIVMDETTYMVWLGGESAALLPSRVVRQVHAVPRGHRLAVSPAAAKIERAKGRCRISICSRAWPTTSTARRCARSATPRRRRC